MIDYKSFFFLLNLCDTWLLSVFVLIMNTDENKMQELLINVLKITWNSSSIKKLILNMMETVIVLVVNLSNQVQKKQMYHTLKISILVEL